MRKFLAMLLSLVMVLSLSVPIAGAEEKKEDKSKEIVILTTNDVHGHIDADIGYATAAALKIKMHDEYGGVLLADAGDFAQGTPYAAQDHGESVVKIMNSAGYDVATLGNHEFDYGQAGREKITDEWANFFCVSCNFFHKENGQRGKSVLPPYRIFTVADKKVAFVGITTPESLTKAAPVYFQDENGNYIYEIAGGEDGAELYAAEQQAIDDAKKDGADIVIGLGHLGVDKASAPWTSEEVIAHTKGLTAMIDGHSHTEVNKNVKDDAENNGGNDVALLQTGSKFDKIGRLIIDGETGKVVTNELLGADSDEIKSLTPEPLTEKMNNDWVKKVKDELGDKIGHTDIVFDNYDTDGKRLVRSQETNSGDLTADALYWYFDNRGDKVDVALMNGGGIRNTAVTGDLSQLECVGISPYGNEACLLTVTGRQLLDALEHGARMAGGQEECGGFMQASGLRYTVDTTVPSTVRTQGKMWMGGPTGAYRVKNVTVFDRESKTWKDLDLKAKYNLAGYNYTLRNGGDGYTMFKDAGVVQDRVALDYMILTDYIKAFPDQEVKASNSPLNTKYNGFGIDYSEVTGDGRISIWTRGGNVLTAPEIPADATEAEKEAIRTADKALRAGGVQADGLADIVSMKKQDNGDVVDVVIDLGKGNEPVTVTAAAIAAANTANGWNAADTKVEAVVYLKAGIKDVTADGEKTGAVVFEIKPFLCVSLVNGDARQVLKEQAVDAVNGAVTIMLPMPEGFTVPDGRKLQVVHTKADGKKFTYDAEMDGRTVSFENPNGFSSFEVTTAPADEAPRTGDTGGMVWWCFLLVTAAAGSAAVLKRKHA